MNKCSIEDCNGSQKRLSDGLCMMHWSRRQYGYGTNSPYKRGTDNGICIIDKCNNYAGPSGACRKHWHKLNSPAKSRNTLLKKKGLTQDKYNLILKKQNKGCAICGGQDQHKGRSLSVDHNHACCPSEKTCGNCTRGLLCGTCNRVLGLVKDNTELLEKMIQYLTTPIDGEDYA